MWNAPPAYSGRGCPRKHGGKFQLKDPETWTIPERVLELSESICGRVKVTMWQGLHFYPAPKHPVNLILVERLDATGNGRLMPPLWLVWTGVQTLSLEEIWHQYLRRFGIEHWYRFAKQRLHWTMPSFTTPEQSGRWSDLMPLMTWQLWLAKDLVTEFRLPWQSVTITLSSGRVSHWAGNPPSSLCFHFCSRLVLRLFHPKVGENLLVGLLGLNVLLEFVIPLLKRVLLDRNLSQKLAN